MANDTPPTGKGTIHISGAGTMAMYILVGSLSMLFAASVLGYAMIRATKFSGNWPPAGYPRLPATLWVSTAVILLSSVTIHFALVGIKHGNEARLRQGLIATALLGLAFLVLQAFNWFEFTHQLSATQHGGQYVNFFYVLTGMHAAHVIGGLIPLFVVLAFALRGKYSANFHPGVRYCAIYWHFLDAIWMMLFVAIYLI